MPSQREPSAVVHWAIQPTMWRTFRRFVVYARNNMRAGLWRNWQRQIFMRYALLVLSAVPAVFLGVRWLVISTGLWLTFMIARSLRALGQNREYYPAGFIRNVFRVTIIVPILTVIDLATFVGTGQWLLLDLFGDRNRA